MAFNKINFGNKTLNYKSFKKLFEEIEKIEDVENTTIDITFNEKDKELEKEHSKTFKNISKLLEYVKDLKKIDRIEVSFWYKNSKTSLKYDTYDYGWILEYSDENNATNAIRFILYNHFKPNIVKRVFLQKTIILWGVWWGMTVLSLPIIGNENIDAQAQYITLGIVLFVLAFLIGLSLYKFLRRTKPYINNKFWEEHKIDIIQNIIFYFLGVVTPYIITGVVAFIKK